MIIAPDRACAPDLIAWGDREKLWPNLTVAQIAQERAARTPDTVLLIDWERSFDIKQLWTEAQALAHWLQCHGIGRGDVISFQLPNWYETHVINLAAGITGAILHPIVPIFRDAEVAFMLRDCGSKAIFVPEIFRNHDYLEMAQRICADMDQPPEIICVRGASPLAHRFAEIVAGDGEVRELAQDPDAIKLLMYTSGTTGRPKGVLHSHNTIHAENVKVARAAGLSETDVNFVPSPVTHVTGSLYGLNLPWLYGIKTILMDVWDGEQAFDQLKTHQCSFMAGATPFLQDLLRIAKERNETLPAMRRYACGGAGVPPFLIHEAGAALPNCRIWRVFGATECPSATVLPDCDERGADTDGQIDLVEVKIVDPQDGSPVADGEAGEILLRAPNMALGYLHREDNERGYDADGFFLTGDLGVLIAGRYLQITGRKKDLIIRGGENISAKEIEDVLIADHRIADVAIVGKPAPRLGEAICAFIVMCDTTPLDMSEVAQIVTSAGLAKQKTPEQLVFLDSLPRTAAGKVQKDLLREWADAPPA